MCLNMQGNVGDDEQKLTLMHSLITSLPFFSFIPSILCILYSYDIIALTTLKLLLVIFLLIFVVAPLIYKYSYGLQRSVIFLNFVNIPSNPNYSDPPRYGIGGVRNFYLITDEEIKLGVWHILPEALINDTTGKDDSYFEDALKNGQDVILYNHGNSGSRLASHRIELYKVLRRNFHVIAYDYRSYGDSADIEPTEVGVVSDCKFMYKWVSERATGKVFVWGHSLGTAISTHTLAELNQENITPTGLILESPFNNMRDEIAEHPFSMLFRHLPWFRYTIIQPMQDNNFTFASDKHITHVDCPILILHAKDDVVVPFRLGKKLYQTARESRLGTQGRILMHEFDEKHKYGHKYICHAPELEDVIKRFVTHCVTEMQKQIL